MQVFRGNRFSGGKTFRAEVSGLFIASGLLIVFALSACSSSVPFSTVETNGNEVGGQTSPEPLAKMSSSPCKTVTTESIDILDAALDRVERATTASEIDVLSDTFNDLFSQAGAAMGTNCAGAEAGEAVSDLIVWVSGAASSRPLVSARFAGGFLGPLCEIAGVDLTPSAQAACAG